MVFFVLFVSVQLNIEQVHRITTTSLAERGIILPHPNRYVSHIVSTQQLLIQRVSDQSISITTGTHLASIHNPVDFNATKQLCREFGGVGCWIGLNDIQGDGIFKYSDGTMFDFGSNNTSSPPWPNKDITLNIANSSDCILIRGTAFASSLDVDHWNSMSCDTVNTYFICNTPSQLCTKDSHDPIQIVHGNIERNGECETVSTGSSMAIVADQIFHDDHRLEIEFIFSINNLSPPHVVEAMSSAGIVLDYHSECRWYYHIGIKLTNDHNAYVFVANISRARVNSMET